MLWLFTTRSTLTHMMPTKEQINMCHRVKLIGKGNPEYANNLHDDTNIYPRSQAIIDQILHSRVILLPSAVTYHLFANMTAMELACDWDRATRYFEIKGNSDQRNAYRCSKHVAIQEAVQGVPSKWEHKSRSDISVALSLTQIFPFLHQLISKCIFGSASIDADQPGEA